MVSTILIPGAIRGTLWTQGGMLRCGLRHPLALVVTVIGLSVIFPLIPMATAGICGNLGNGELSIAKKPFNLPAGLCVLVSFGVRFFLDGGSNFQEHHEPPAAAHCVPRRCHGILALIEAAHRAADPERACCKDLLHAPRSRLPWWCHTEGARTACRSTDDQGGSHRRQVRMRHHECFLLSPSRPSVAQLSLEPHPPLFMR